MALHKIAKSLGYPDNETFYSHYPTQEHYEQALMKCGGKLPMYNTGGDILSTIAPAAELLNLAIPGLGTAGHLALSTAGKLVNNIGDKEDTTPNPSDVVFNPNKFGTMKNGGFNLNPAHKGYNVGEEHDLPEEEIQRLIKLGYKIQRL